MFPRICQQNGRTLQILDLTFMKIRKDPLTSDDIQLIVDNCVNLKEVDFTGCRLSENCVEILVNNISQNVEKLGLDGPGIHAEDKHIVALVSRCKKLTSLNLAYGEKLTDISLTSIILNFRLLIRLDAYFKHI